MRSLLTVTTAADSQDLTSVDAVKLELGITDSSSDAHLLTLIHQASGIVADYCGRVFGSEEVSQTFWHEAGDSSFEYLVLDRFPVSSIDTVTVDDVEIDSAEYRLVANSGLLYALDSSGYPTHWFFCKSAIVNYTGGYALLGALPWAIERATILLVKGMYSSVARDPRAKSEEIPGVMSVSYWVGSVGDPNQLPPDVTSLLAPHRRVFV